MPPTPKKSSPKKPAAPPAATCDCQAQIEALAALVQEVAEKVTASERELAEQVAAVKVAIGIP